MSFQFQIPRKVRTGRGALTDFLAAASAYGTRALIVTGRHVRQLDAFRQLTDGLGAHHIAFTVFDGIPGEPEFSTVLHCTEGATVMLNAVLKADCD